MFDNVPEETRAWYFNPMLSLLLRIWTTLMAMMSRLGGIVQGISDLKAGQARLEVEAKLQGEMLEALIGKTDHLIDLLEPGPAVKFIFVVELEGQITYGVTMLELKDTQQATLSIQPVDANPAPVDGAPVWTTSNSEVVSVQAAEDGLSAIVKAVGPLGSAVVSVKADADVGEGVTQIAGVLEVQVFAGAAVTVQIKAGTPEEQSQ